MKLFIFAACIAMAYGQYDCGTCDTMAARQDRTGCRLFCNIDVDADDLYSATDVTATYTNWACGAGCDEAGLSAAIKDVVQVCDSEVSLAFALLSTQDPAGDDTLVQENDLEAWRVAIETDYGTGNGADEAAFQGWWAFRYPLLEDPTCTSG